MTPETVMTLFSIGGEIAKHIWGAIQRGDAEELRRLSDVFPEGTQTKIALLAAEEKARQRVRRAPN